MNGSQPIALIIDDDQNMRWTMRNILSDAGIQVAEAEAGRSGLEAATHRRPHVVLLDMRMPDLGGDEVLKHLRRFDPDLPVIMVTAHGTISSAVSVTRDGAFDFITKPFRNEHLVETVQRAIALRPVVHRTDAVRAAVTRIMGQGSSIQRLADQIEAVLPTSYSVVIYGESGAGKEVVAHALYQHSQRSTRSFVIVDCGAIEETLIESEFFGHEKGSYTGAIGRHQGCFELAGNGGTIFLDEIGNLPLKGQKALLRTLEEHSIRRIGGRESIKLDLRVIAATNSDLRAQVKSGNFRQDLLFRLQEFVITIPPLRSRPEDIPFLAQRFLTQAQEALGRLPIEIAPTALELLCSHQWPGNVRELRNVMRRVALTRSEVITPDHVAVALGDSATPAIAAQEQHISASLRDQTRNKISALECEAVFSALDQAKGNKSAAARLLGIDYKTYRTKLKKLLEGRGAIAHGRT